MTGVPNPERVTGARVCIGPVAAPAFDPAASAKEYFGQFPLPSPQASIPPGKMIVAFPAFVVTAAPTRYEVTVPTPFGPLRVAAIARVFVNWGDGERTGPYDGPGRPYPNGDIVHRYADAGRYDVSVVYRWSATWEWGGQGGPVAGTLDTVDRIVDFPVQEYQARTN
ncbi:MAG: hypothetical protein HYX34_10480 [Actinobacteria bacterium]|nr:hypothetical protein [Actinomycetota bacterium]